MTAGMRKRESDWRRKRESQNKMDRRSALAARAQQNEIGNRHHKKPPGKNNWEQTLI